MESSRQIYDRKELMKAYDDIQFRILIHDYSMYEAEMQREEFGKIHVLPTTEASDKFHRAMDRAFRSEHRRNTVRNVPKALRRVAVVFIVCFLMFSVSIVTVNALRVDVLNFLIYFQKEYTSIRLDSDNMVVGDNLIVPWTDSYAPTYVPDGYKIVRISFSENMKSIDFTNENGDYISYYDYALKNAANLDTENADEVEEIDINGFAGLYISKNGYSTVAWSMKNRIFVIVAQINHSEIVQIAESVKYVE